MTGVASVAGVAGALFARRMLVIVCVPLLAATWAQAVCALSRRMHNSDLIVEAAKLKCSVSNADEEICEAAYGKDHRNIIDKIFDEKPRSALGLTDW